MTGHTARLLGTFALTGTIFLAGCGDGEAREDGAVPSAQAPAAGQSDGWDARDGAVGDGSDGEASGAASGSASGEPARSGSPDDADPADPNTPVEHRVDGRSGSVGAGGSTAGARPGSGTEPGASGQSGQSAEPGASPRGATQEEILRATSRAYEGLRSFRAGFEQTLENTILGRTTRSEGTLYQRQPDRFLMEFSDPPDDLIVSDGEYFWMYFPSVDAKQVLRSARGSQGLDLHAQFIGDPVRRFETTYHGTETVRGRPAHVMTLVPRESLGYRRLKVWIDSDDHLVRRFVLTETNDNIRHFVLRDLVKNPRLSDDMFAFTPPPGAQVVTR